MKIKSPLLGKQKKFMYTDPLIGLLFLITILSVGILFLIYFRPLYYLDIYLLDLEKATGLSASTIRSNYNALMNYCSPFHGGSLSFPTLASSSQGLSHFSEVKVIFQWFHVTALIGLILSGLVIWYKREKKQYSYLYVSSITIIILPAIVGIVSLINFNAAFTLMHKIFFRNDDWLFDPGTDPIINLLPEAFFLHCGIIIILFLFAGSLVLYLLHLKIKKQKPDRPLFQTNRNYYY